jgi:hypothetical protein
VVAKRLCTCAGPKPEGRIWPGRQRGAARRGSRVLEGTVKNQLGGALSLAWMASGLVCDIEVLLGRKNPEDHLHGQASVSLPSP